MNSSRLIIYDFTSKDDLASWRIVNDEVMGGRSQGFLEINNNGHAAFYGGISLENNGGFSSVRHQFKEKDISEYSQVLLRVKGDGKTYQFRVKEHKDDRYAYVKTFQTNQKWQTITFKISDMKPMFRGRLLGQNGLKSDKIQQVAFLIANKKAEKFHLEIDFIALK